jgi:hypothetical protein
MLNNIKIVLFIISTLIFFILTSSSLVLIVSAFVDHGFKVYGLAMKVFAIGYAMSIYLLVWIWNTKISLFYDTFKAPLYISFGAILIATPVIFTYIDNIMPSYLLLLSSSIIYISFWKDYKENIKDILL